MSLSCLPTNSIIERGLRKRVRHKKLSKRRVGPLDSWQKEANGAAF